MQMLYPAEALVQSKAQFIGMARSRGLNLLNQPPA